MFALIAGGAGGELGGSEFWGYIWSGCCPAASSWPGGMEGRGWSLGWRDGGMEVEQGPDPDRLELPWRTLATVRGRWEAGLSPCKGTQAWLCGGGGMQGPANKAK